MISLSTEEFQTIQKIIVQYLPHTEIWVFGSRSTQVNLKPFSDLDLVIYDEQPITPALLGKMREAFSDSLLPFKVDLLVWSEVSMEFQKIITAQKQVMIQKSA